MSSSHPLHPSMAPSSSPLVFPPPSPSPSAINHNNYSPNPPNQMSLSAQPHMSQPAAPSASAAAARRISVASAVSARSSLPPGDTIFGSAPVGVIGRTKPREIVRIERDYSMGERCQFWSGWVWELEGRITPTEFQNTMNELNTVLASAHDPAKSCVDNCLAVLTLYTSPWCLGSHYEREMKQFGRVIERANREVFNPAGLNILDPKRTGYLFLEIEYY